MPPHPPRLHRSLVDLGYPGLTFALGMATWEAITRLGVPSYILPAPSSVFWKLVEARGPLLRHTFVTAIEIVLGFTAALAIGILLSAAVVYLKPFERAVYPWIVATQVVPKVAIAPLLIVWLGFGLVPKIMISCLIAFFPILIDTVIGLRSIDPESIFLFRSMGARRWEIFRHLQLPNALPNIFGGMKVAITLATVGAIVGEFIGANEGLGYVLLFANGILDTTLLFAALVAVSFLALLFYLLVSLLERLCIRWHVSVRSASALVSM